MAEGVADEEGRPAATTDARMAHHTFEGVVDRKGHGMFGSQILTTPVSFE